MTPVCLLGRALHGRLAPLLTLALPAAHLPPCSAQDFEKAGSLRDREMELKSQIAAITSSAKDAQVRCRGDCLPACAAARLPVTLGT